MQIKCHPFWSSFKDVQLDHSLDETPLGRSSTILKGKPGFITQLMEWVPENQWRCIYRASQDGWKGPDFHKKCDGLKPTVTLIKVGDYIFGGYTDQDWTPVRNKCK